MIFETDLLLRVKATPGSEIPLYKLREFIVWLSNNYFNFGKISYDGFQSADSIQLLKTQGYPADLLSLDRDDVPYLNLRSCFMERRIIMPYHELLIEELAALEHDKKNRKVDHPIIAYGNVPGSKDLADAVCGAAYDAYKYYAESKKRSDPNQPQKLQTNMRILKNLQEARRKQSKEELFDDSWVT
jgi:hypothetical protein